MEERSSIFENWPHVPESKRPREIFIMNVFPTAKELNQLEDQGYILVDVRTIENDIQQVEAILRGLTEATILPLYRGFEKFLEFRMKALGLTSRKETQQKDEEDLDEKSIDDLLKGIDSRGMERANVGKQRNKETAGTKRSRKAADGKAPRPKRSANKTKIPAS